MYEWLQDAQAPDDLVDNLRRDVADSDVYVFTPNGEVKELPQGATPLDFAYYVHSEVGHQCIGARVHGRMVPLRYNLQTGDVVEILTSKNQTPHLDWLDTVVTGKARTRIRQRLRELGALEPLDGQIRRHAEEAAPEPKQPVSHDVDDATREKMIRIEGGGGFAVAFAKCCRPMPGTPVIGYVTKGAGISIHRADCRNFAISRRDPSRVVAASWVGDETIEVGMRVAVGQRPNILADITNAVRPMNISITKAQYIANENGVSIFEFTFEAPDRESIDRVARTVQTVTGVTDVVTLQSHPPATALAH
jgi:GTP pyrophosphokinase